MLSESTNFVQRGEVSMPTFRDQVAAHESECDDSVVSTRLLGYAPGDRVRFQDGGREAELFGAQGAPVEAAVTRRALGQLSERLDGPGLRWLGDESRVNDELRADVVNALVRHREPVELLLRRKGDLLRAVLSDQYSTFNHADYVDLLAGAVEQMGDYSDSVAVMNPEIGDELRGYLVVPGLSFGRDPQDTGGSAGLHPAVYFSNSEVGTGKVRLHGGLYQSACTNGMIVGWSAEDRLELVHRHLSARTIASAVADALAGAFRMSEQAADRMLATSRVMLRPSALDSLLTDWGERYGIPVPVISAWRHASDVVNRRVELTQVGAVNAATSLAKQYNGAEREALERMAGDLLFADLPESVVVGAEVAGYGQG